MADTKTTRRTAEKAAEAALSDTLIGIIGDLGVAHADCGTAKDVVTAARTRADAVIAKAKTEADKIMTTAQTSVTDAGSTYNTAWQAAKTAGWSPAQLRALGYKPATARRPVAKPNASPQPPSATQEPHL